MTRHKPLLNCPCCAMHAALMWPSGMAAGAGGPTALPGTAPSFTDVTLKEPTPAASAGDVNTRDLFEDAEPGRWVILRGGTVLPMTSVASLPNHDILIRDGVIQDVRPGGAKLPEGSLIVDASGKFVIPGLSDIHTHPTLAPFADLFAPVAGPHVAGKDILMPYDLQMFMYLAGGVTRTEIMAGTAEELALRHSIRTGQIRGPSMRVASPVIEGYPPMQPSAIALIATDADGGRRAAQTIAERGFDFAKPYTRLNRETYTALAEECHRLGITIMGHVPKDVGVEDAIALGQHGIAHVFEFFWHDPPEMRGDPTIAARRAKLAADNGVDVQTTICAGYMFEYDSGFNPTDPRVKQFLNPLLNLLMDERSPFIQGWRSDPDRAEPGRHMGRHSVQMTQALLAAGARILPGTDMTGSNVLQGYCTHEELRLYVDEVGMTPLEALRAATRTCAEYHGEGAAAGTVSRGIRSDLVVLDRDPGVDINATREIDAVLVGRSILRREAIARGMARVRERYAAMPIRNPWESSSSGD